MSANNIHTRPLASALRSLSLLLIVVCMSGNAYAQRARHDRQSMPVQPVSQAFLIEPGSFQQESESNAEAWRDATNKLFEISLATTPDEAVEKLLNELLSDEVLEEANQRDLILIKVNLPKALLDKGIEKTISRLLKKSIPGKPIVKLADSDNHADIKAVPKNSLTVSVSFQAPQPSQNSDDMAIAKLEAKIAEAREAARRFQNRPGNNPDPRIVASVETDVNRIEPIEAGTLVVSIEGLEEPVSGSMKFVNKPWVHNFDAFASEHENEFLVLARSDLKSTQTETHMDAIENAARNISQVIIRARYTNLNHMWGEIYQQTKLRLLTGDWVVDRVVQELKRPYGSVWREALLVRLDENDLAQLLNQHQKFAVQYRRRQIDVGTSIVGILAVSILLFWVLNFWTKGYHRGKITASVILLAGAGLVVIYFAMARELFT
jgi:hypothetical protein